MWLLFACSPASPVDDAALQKARAAVAADEVGRERQVSARRHAMGSAATVSAGSAPCPIQVPVPSMHPGSFSSPADAVAAARGAQFLADGLEQVTDPERLGSSVGPAVLRRDRERAALGALLDDPAKLGELDDPPRALAEKVEALTEPLGWDAALVAGLTTSPITAGDTFQAGSMIGRLLIYSYADARVVCVADAVASNSGQVHVVRTEVGGVPITSTPLTDRMALHDDLVVNLLATAVPELRAVAQ